MLDYDVRQIDQEGKQSTARRIASAAVQCRPRRPDWTRRRATNTSAPDGLLDALLWGLMLMQGDERCSGDCDLTCTGTHDANFGHVNNVRKMAMEKRALCDDGLLLRMARRTNASVA